MAAENVSFLVQMGFTEEISKSALLATGDNLEAAVNWALENKSAGSKMEKNGNGSETTGEAGQEAKSLKCEDCGKLFKNIEQAELHGLRTNHENFAECTDEIKPLTAEEKKQQAERVLQLLAERRLKRVQEEQDSELEREKQRRLAAKNLTQIKQQMVETEVKKMLDDRKREKQDDRVAKQRILEQIERDKADRKAREAREKSGGQEVAAAAPVPAKVETVPVKSNAAEARIQVRLPTGSQFTQVFASSETLAAVRCLILVKEPSISDTPSAISLMCPFMGRKVFTEDDMEKSLAELGLAPSAALIAQKKAV